MLGSPSAVCGVLAPVVGDLLFEAVADGQQLRLGHDALLAFLHVELENVGQNDGVNRAGFFAEPAVNALEQVDVVARGAAGAVLALLLASVLFTLSSFSIF